MAVHIMGEPADMEPILALARRHRLKVLEDCAQSAGATYKGRAVGSMGDCGIYSFQLCKMISAGEGGAVVTSDPEIFERAARLHDIGKLRRPHAAMLGASPRFGPLVGWNFRMNEYTGADFINGAGHLVTRHPAGIGFQETGSRVSTSLWQMPQARTRIRTSSRPGCGTSRSTKSKGAPGLVACTALILRHGMVSLGLVCECLNNQMPRGGASVPEAFDYV